MILHKFIYLFTLLFSLASFSTDIGGQLKTNYTSFLVGIIDEPGSEFEFYLTETTKELQEDSCISDTKIIGDFRKVDGRLGYEVPTLFSSAFTLMVTGCPKQKLQSKVIRRKMLSFVFDRDAISFEPGDQRKALYKMLVFPDNFKAELIRIK